MDVDDSGGSGNSSTPPRAAASAIPEPVRKDQDTQLSATRPGIENQQVVDFREVGATGLKRFSGFIYDEFLPELTQWAGAQTYKEMAWNDATVAAVLFAIKSLCRRAKWLVEPASPSGADHEAAEFLETCMNDMAVTWVDLINEVLTMLEYGYCVEEVVYKRRCGDVFDPAMRSKYADGRIGWRKFSIRSQDTIYRWQFDDHGGIQGVEQIAPPHYYRVTIPVEKFLLFRTRVDRNNPEGFSILRPAYRSWYIKHQIENIEAIGVERDLAGLPVALVPPEILSQNASGSQKQLLSTIKAIINNIRRNEQEGVIFPLDYDAVTGKPRYELKLLSTGGTRQFDTSAVINRWDQRITMSMMADFLLLGQDKVGSYALSETKTTLFSTAIGSFLDIIADVFNNYAVPRLFALNDFVITDYPKIKHGDLGHVDIGNLGKYIQALAQAGMPLFPNNELEKHLCEVAGLPTGALAETAEHPSLMISQTAQAGRQEEIAADDKEAPHDDGYPTDNTPANQKPPFDGVTATPGNQMQRSNRPPRLGGGGRF